MTTPGFKDVVYKPPRGFASNGTYACVHCEEDFRSAHMAFWHAKECGDRARVGLPPSKPVALAELADARLLDDKPLGVVIDAPNVDPDYIAWRRLRGGPPAFDFVSAEARIAAYMSTPAGKCPSDLKLRTVLTGRIVSKNPSFTAPFGGKLSNFLAQSKAVDDMREDLRALNEPCQHCGVDLRFSQCWCNRGGTDTARFDPAGDLRSNTPKPDRCPWDNFKPGRDVV